MCIRDRLTKALLQCLLNNILNLNDYICVVPFCFLWSACFVYCISLYFIIWKMSISKVKNELENFHTIVVGVTDSDTKFICINSSEFYILLILYTIILYYILYVFLDIKYNIFICPQWQFQNDKIISFNCVTCSY